MLIEVYCQGGSSIGFGHVARATDIAWELKQQDFDVRMCANSLETEKILPPVPNDFGDASAIVIDLPSKNMTPIIVKAKSEGKKVIALEYYEGIEEPDLNISLMEYVKPVPSGLRVSGIKYAFVRSEVLQQRKKALRSKGESVIVMMGGSDKNGNGQKISQTLYDMGESVTLINGPLASSLNNSQELDWICLKNPLDLPERMATCKWAVTNGGISMLEMFCLGKAVHAIPQTHHESILVNYFALEGCLIGMESSVVSIPSEKECEQIKHHVSGIIDGKGLSRVVADIKSFL